MGPILLVLLVNAVLYVCVVFVLLRHTRSTMARRQQVMSFKTAFRLMASIGSIMFLFGLSWFSAALTITVPHLRYLAQILFAISNSLQGFFLFLFFCVLNLEARESWKEVLSCGRYKSKVLHPHVGSEVGSQHRVPSTSSGAMLQTAMGGRVLEGFSSVKSSPHSTMSHLHACNRHAGIRTASQSSLDSPASLDAPVTPAPEGQGAASIRHCLGVEQHVDKQRGKPMNARVQRYSTMNQHVEEYQVDFYDSSGEENAS